MQSVVFVGEGRWEVREAPEPRLERPDDVLVEVGRAGICGTDLHILAVPPGHPATAGVILGHEYSGRVVEAGRSAGFSPGDHVVVDPNVSCGACDFCRQGRTNQCARMRTLGIFENGGLARYSLAPARALHSIDPSVPPERAALAEPLSCIYAAVEKAPPRPGDSVVVLGAGPIGLMFVLLYRRMGAGTIVAVEPRDLRRAVAAEIGADLALDFSPRETAGEVRGVLPHGAEIVVDAVGTMLPLAMELARPGGTILLFGMIQKPGQPISQYDVTRKELQIVGSYIQRTAFPRVTRLLAQRDFPVEKVISHQLPLARIGEAFDAMRRGLALKVVLDPAG